MSKKASSQTTASANKAEKSEERKRAYLSQTEVPSYSLEQALRVPKAIAEHLGYKTSKPLQVAKAMGMQPNSGQFRGRCGAAVAYGLTKGSYSAPEISIEPLGMRIVRPLEEEDDLLARREALLKPRVIGEFLRRYNGAPLPRLDIAQNVLTDMGVPPDKTESVLSLILEGAESVGFIEEIKGKKYVDLGRTPSFQSQSETDSQNGGEAEEAKPQVEESGKAPIETPPEIRRENQPIGTDAVSSHTANKRRVFITHGKNKAFIEPIKKLLGFGELEAVVSVERQSVSQPVPDKVMSDMRGCGAAIIHVDAELKLIDQEANEHVILNPNVLMEIGAAIALYGRRFILLVKEGVKLPTNLQGLYEVRYKGDNLDGEATIKLLEAINDIKNHPLPARYSNEETPK